MFTLLLLRDDKSKQKRHLTLLCHNKQQETGQTCWTSASSGGTSRRTTETRGAGPDLTPDFTFSSCTNQDVLQVIMSTLKEFLH